MIDVSGLSNIFDKFHVPLVVSWANQIQLIQARNRSEQWSLIREKSNINHHNNDSTGRLIFDKQGRLINYSQNVHSLLRSLGVDYEPASKRRLCLERFEGDNIIYPHDEGLWVKGDWVEPIRDQDEILGFQIHLPGSKQVSKRNPDRSDSANRAKNSTDPFSRICGNSTSTLASIDKARKAATIPLPILVLGDTGVGKEVFAQAIHEASNLSSGPFIDLNCGAFSKDILSSELFGHVEGAYTGAKKGGMMGKIEAANGGTLLLDEIGEMPLEIQPIFLRVLQERKIQRVGDIEAVPVNFRLIAATNTDLRNAVDEGRFRKDLYFRLSAVTISLDPLSERKDDIEEIAQMVFQRTKHSQQIIPNRMAKSLITA